MMASEIKHQGDDIFLSLVGQQPSATAVLLKSWIAKNRAPAMIRLLATPAVQRNGTASRLLTFCRKAASEADCEIVPIAPGLEDAPNPPSAVTWVRQFLHEQNQAGNVIFAADPGPNFLVAAVARLLPPRAILLHADSHSCWAYTRWEGDERRGTLPLEDLTWDTLLALYGLEAEQSQQELHPLLQKVFQQLKIRIPNTMHRAVVFRGLPDAESLPRLELTFEARGRLYGLCVAEGNDILQQIRKIERIALSLKNLNPHISVYTPSPYQRRRIRAEGLEALTSRTLREWVASCQAVRPGRAVEPDTSWGDTLPRFFSGGGGEDTTPLLVWMGAEPSSTLTSIWTHRPKELVLLYDRITPVVVEKVKRLLECAKRIPVDNIHLWPSDYLGCIVSKGIQNQFPNAKADVSPGTKAQTVVFARLPGLKLWSLRPPNAVALDGQESIPLRYPDLLTMTRIHSGKLHDAGRGIDVMKWGAKKVRFLRLLGRAITQAPRNLPLDPLTPFDESNASLEMHTNGKWCVRVDNEQASGKVPPKGGGWLEQVVAAAFVNAGAQEVYLNLKWAWPPGMEVPQNGFRAELDIAARIGPAVFAVSCKLRAQNLTLRKLAAEIEAVARTHFGQFAIPVVVRVRLAPNQPPEKGAVLFDLKTVVGDDFRQKLDEAARARRTLES
jgi:hypothetical protein